jgi:hypothetical protein
MKTNIFITLVLFFLFGFASQEFAQMNLQERETAKKEIGEVVNIIFRDLEKMDVEALSKSYSDLYDFILITTNASIANYQEANTEHAKWFKSLSSLKVTTIREEFRFLPGNTVICAWQGKFEMMQKTGVQYKIDRFGITFIFSKIDNLWKVIYQHSSSVPPVKEETKK